MAVGGVKHNLKWEAKNCNNFVINNTLVAFDEILIYISCRYFSNREMINHKSPSQKILIRSKGL